MGSVHLLLAMARQRGCAGQILRAFGVDVSVAEDMTVLLYGRGAPMLPLPQGLTEAARRIFTGARA